MIKVIRHGEKPIMTCETCGCVFSYDKSDAIVTQDRYNEVTYSVKCPDCGEMVRKSY